MASTEAARAQRLRNWTKLATTGHLVRPIEKTEFEFPAFWLTAGLRNSKCLISVSLTTGSTLNPDPQLGHFGQPIKEKKEAYNLPPLT